MSDEKCMLYPVSNFEDCFLNRKSKMNLSRPSKHSVPFAKNIMLSDVTMEGGTDFLVKAAQIVIELFQKESWNIPSFHGWFSKPIVLEGCTWRWSEESHFVSLNLFSIFVFIVVLCRGALWHL
jgi:hypothetical protein